MDFMTFRTNDYNVWASQGLDFCLITTFKNNFGEIHISQPTPGKISSLSLDSFLVRLKIPLVKQYCLHHNIFFRDYKEGYYVLNPTSGGGSVTNTCLVSYYS